MNNNQPNRGSGAIGDKIEKLAESTLPFSSEVFKPSIIAPTAEQEKPADKK